MNDRPLTSSSVSTRIALGCMGLSGACGKNRRRTVHRRYSGRDRRWRDISRYWRLLRRGTQRASHRQRNRRPPRPGQALSQVRHAARSRQQLGWHRRAPRGGELPRVLPAHESPGPASQLLRGDVQRAARAAYRLWVRGKAAKNRWTNDSVYVQFSHSIHPNGGALWRIGITSATMVSIERCSGCGLSEWGWADNGYGIEGTLDFNRTGQTIRIQSREDGVTIDQIVLAGPVSARLARIAEGRCDGVSAPVPGPLNFPSRLPISHAVFAAWWRSGRCSMPVASVVRGRPDSEGRRRR